MTVVAYVDDIEGAVEIDMPEDKALTRIEQIRKVLATKSFAKIEGVLMDMQTANLVCSIYDRLNPTNQDKLSQMSLPHMVDTCWKVYARASK